LRWAITPPPFLHAKKTAAAASFRNHFAKAQLTLAWTIGAWRRVVVGVAAEEVTRQYDGGRCARTGNALFVDRTDRFNQERTWIIAGGVARAPREGEGFAAVFDVGCVITRANHIDGKLDLAVIKCHPEKHTGAAFCDNGRQPLADVRRAIDVEDECVAVQSGAIRAGQRI
jgi:hypothetical protein